MLELGVLADDLTGGMMVASLLEREGVRCPLVTSADALSGIDPTAEAVVVARKIRLIDRAKAEAEARQVATALATAGAKRLFYKYCATFDSTEQGNIGPVGQALVEATDAERTIFCPAFPEYTVAVFQGRLFLGATMLGESFKRFDPVTPMKNSNLVEVLQAQSDWKVGLLSHNVLRRGQRAVEAELGRQADARLFIADAVDDEDLTRLAEIVESWPVTTGADALPMFLARTWRAGRPGAAGEQRTLLPPSPGHEAVIAGSCAEATLRQLEWFESRYPVFRVDLEKAAGRPEYVDDIVAWARPKLGDGPVAVATSADVPGVERLQAALGRAGAAELADSILGRVAAALFDLGVRKFVVAGGETSGQVVNSIGIQRVSVSAFDELGGGYCHQDTPEPLSLVLKAGALGQQDFFFKALERMRAADTSQ